MINSESSVPYPNSYWVVPGQFLAGEHPMDFRDETTRARLSALLAAGIRTFVDLTQPHEMGSYHQVLRTLAEERQTEITFLRIPVQDRRVPPESTLINILDEIDRSMSGQKAVFVHCFAGIGRTGTVVGCYLRRHGWASQRDVIARIAGLRRLMPIGEGASPHTAEQVGVVETWKDGA